MKKIVFTWVVLLSMTLGASAQVKTMGASLMAIKGVKIPPPNWPFLSFSMDSVYGMEVNRAYEFLKDKPKKRKVIVAVMDSGTDVDHEDLKANLWVNPGEIPGNGIDDDGNGYVDDVHGWNFLGKSDGTLLAGGVEEGDRQFTLHRERYDQLFVKKRDKREEKEFNRLRDLFGMSKLGKVYLNLEKAREGGDEKAVEKLEKQFATSLGQLLDDRAVIGDDLEDPDDRFYGNNVLWSGAANRRILDHGTHVAGIIGAERDNGIGIDGVADGVELMIVRAIPTGDEYDKDVAVAIRYAVDNGANIINMSFAKNLSPQLKWVQKALKYADKKGVLVIHASGNNALNIDDEIFYPNPFIGKKRIASFLVVGASDENGNPAKFSNYGKKQVDVFTPGVFIKSTIPGNAYTAKEGTSMASPMAAGVAALLMGYYPELSASQVRDIMMQTAITRRGDIVSRSLGYFSNKREDIPFSSLCAAGGIVNAFEAVKLADRMVYGKTK